MQPSWREKTKKTNKKTPKEKKMALSKWTNRKEVWGDQQADMKCDAPCRSPRGKGSSFRNATAEHLDERRQDWRGARSSRCLSRQNKRSLWKRYHPVWGTALVERVTFASAWISWVVHFILFPTCTHSQFRDAQFVFSKFEATRGRRRLDLRRGIHHKLHRVENAPTVTGVKLKVSPGFQ